ncbi:MAG TPA: hypothetical protein VFP22_06685, partial [Candidatus Limnocylindrales bacterium]|nr:hypothetical protein [Candidatus Limnocylindrales bacterium]
MTSRHSFLRVATPLAMLAILASACTGGGSSPSTSAAASQPAASTGGSSTAPSTAASQGASPDPMAALATAAKAEGGLTTIALPHDWCNYGEALTTFTQKYGIPINELTPDAGSGDEVNAIKANKDNKGPQAPDVIDVG